jgi:ribosomal-protein-alanine N-acetyltransferase
MNLKTKRLKLEEITTEDLYLVHDIHSVAEVDEFNTLGIPKDLDETRKVMQPDIDDQVKNPRSRFCWKILHAETGEFIGLAGMFLSNDRFKMGEFYYKFYPTHWGKGYATETARALIKFGFNECKLHRIEAGVATQNSASVRVLEKSGMTCEGIRRKILPIRGEWKDNFHFAIIEDEFKDASVRQS